MSMKKKLGSKLSEGVRQVKSQREPAPDAAPVKTMPKPKPAANPIPASVATEPEPPRGPAPAEPSLNKLHPRRVWPD